MPRPLGTRHIKFALSAEIHEKNKRVAYYPCAHPIVFGPRKCAKTDEPCPTGSKFGGSFDLHHVSVQQWPLWPLVGNKDSLT